MDDMPVQIELSGTIAIVTLNRPQARNALSQALMLALTETFEQLQRDPAVTAAILTGAGSVFCAGLDLRELEQTSGLEGRDLALDNRMATALESFDRPLIGAINGAAVTGGFELALICDVLYASHQARFADTHARIGVIPGWGLSQRLSRLIGLNRAREMSLSGNFIDAQRAESWGLVNRVLPAAELLPAALELARQMSECDPHTLRNYKRLINEGAAVGLGDALRLERTWQSLAQRPIDPDEVARRRAALMERSRQQP